MFIEFNIDIRTLVVSWKTFLELLLDSAHSILVLLGYLFIIRINLSNIFPSSLFQHIIEIELIR